MFPYWMYEITQFRFLIQRWQTVKQLSKETSGKAYTYGSHMGFIHSSMNLEI
jgi:hypothetical protein